MTDGVIDLAAKIRDIPDFPKQGILFRDIMPLLQDPKALREAVDRIVEYGVGKHVDVVLGAEARGFILGAAVAYGLGAGFVCARKPGKLPYETDRRRVRPRVRHRPARDPRRRHQARPERARSTTTSSPPAARRAPRSSSSRSSAARSWASPSSSSSLPLHGPRQARGLRHLQPGPVLTSTWRRLAGARRMAPHRMPTSTRPAAPTALDGLRTAPLASTASRERTPVR